AGRFEIGGKDPPMAAAREKRAQLTGCAHPPDFSCVHPENSGGLRNRDRGLSSRISIWRPILRGLSADFSGFPAICPLARCSNSTHLSDRHSTLLVSEAAALTLRENHRISDPLPIRNT